MKSVLSSPEKQAALAEYKKVYVPLLLTFLVLATFGLVMMFSASYGVSYVQEHGSATTLFMDQTKISGLGLIIGLFIAFVVKIRFLDRPVFRYLVYMFTTLFLIAVPLVGVTVNGARRWIRVFGVSIQPSEMAKVAAIFFLATYFSEQRKKQRLHTGRRLKRKGLQPLYDAFVRVTFPTLMIGIWIIMIALQPHMSGAIILTLVTIFMFMLEGLPFKLLARGWFIIVLFVLIAVLLFVAIGPVVTGQPLGEFLETRFAHVINRLSNFVNPEDANPDEMRQVQQAQIALGSGGMFGVGLGRSIQKLNWLSESHNDFILPIIGEELGFVGTMVCLMLFVLFFIFGMIVAVRAATPMTTMIAAGYTFLITIQALLNFAVATNILPPTGISLPFFSSGGSANFFFMVAAGMLLCVSKSGKEEHPDIAQYLERGKSSKRKAQRRKGAKVRTRPV